MTSIVNTDICYRYEVRPLWGAVGKKQEEFVNEKKGYCKNNSNGNGSSYDPYSLRRWKH